MMRAFAETVDLATAFDAIHEHWSPNVVAQVNDQYVKVAKVQGEFAWHSHAEEDELFYVVRGHLDIKYENGRTVSLAPGSLHVVPRGVQHKPVAQEECWIVLIETVSTKHTGDVETPYTKTLAQQLGQA
ncbi:MAG: cupin domain-containing protein [Paraburkholderia sp.]|uniref:cupin domain-containing protein n=1 Tax=Paraburkholderia sp. TaxID=1926495 RepID=UPI00121CF574|nr:cupin domain-containing protein [Paraburkholderia sp.]TAL98133.1 MAG: cupin domain-containing protein [Paraburkholderia sp.]